MKKLFWIFSLAGLTPFALAAHETQETASAGTQTGPLLSVQSTLGDLLRHPALAGFALRMLPWDGGHYEPDMKWQNAASLMPYHSNIYPQEIVSSINRLIADAQNGQTVFYDFYTDAQKRREPAKKHTGLFFFRGKEGAPFAVVCPGGGFAYVGALHEGFPVAQKISESGFNAFVIKYRAGSGQWAVEDLAAALSYIEKHAEELGVAARGYSLWGGSAGARMAAAVGSYGTAVFGADEVSKPAAVIMAYTGQSSFTPQDPPTFIAVGDHDYIATAAVMARRAEGLRRAGVPMEFHEYKGLRHGFGLGTGTAAEGWVKQAVEFWKKFIKQEKKA